MDKDEFKDLSTRCQELQKFFEDVRVTFSRHTDADTDAKLKTAVSQFKTLNQELDRVANGEIDIGDAHIHEIEIAEHTGEEAISLVEGVIEEEIKIVAQEISDLR